MRPWRYLDRDLIEMPLHGLGVAAWQDESRADAAGGTDGAKDPGRHCPSSGRSGPGSSFCPAPRDGFLSNRGFVLPPNLYRGVERERGPDFCQFGGKVFLKSSMANSFCPGGAGAPSRNPSALNSRPHARFLKRDAILFVYPKRQVLPTPAHHAVDRWDRPIFNDPRKGLPLCVRLGRLGPSPSRHQSDQLVPWR